MRRPPLHLALVMGVTLGMLAACSSGATASPGGQSAAPSSGSPAPSVAGQGVIFYLLPGLFDEFQAGSQILLEQYGAEKGFTVKSLNANNNATTQIQQFDDAIAQKPKAIVVAAVDTATIGASIEKAKAAGIIVTAYDRFVTNTAVDFTCTADVTKIGKIGAEEIVRLLTKKNGSPKGTVLEQMGDPGDSYTIGIDQGFTEAIAAYPDIKVNRKTAAGWEPTVAATTIDDVLTANPNVDLVWVHSEGLAPAIVPVLEKHGFAAGDGKIIFLGTSGLPVGLDLVRQGWMIETIDYPLSPEYKSTIDAIAKILAGETLKVGTWEIDGYKNELKIETWGPTLYLPGEIITKANVDDPNLWGNIKLPSK